MKKLLILLGFFFFAAILPANSFAASQEIPITLVPNVDSFTYVGIPLNPVSPINVGDDVNMGDTIVAYELQIPEMPCQQAVFEALHVRQSVRGAQPDEMDRFWGSIISKELSLENIVTNYNLLEGGIIPIYGLPGRGFDTGVESNGNIEYYVDKAALSGDISEYKIVNYYAHYSNINISTEAWFKYNVDQCAQSGVETISNVGVPKTSGGESKFILGFVSILVAMNLALVSKRIFKSVY
jgi:hypothetical protein